MDPHSREPGSGSKPTDLSKASGLSGGNEIGVPINEFIREIAREAAREIVRCHKQDCPIEAVRTRVEALERWNYALYGAMLGSGIIGGGVGTLLGLLFQ